MPGDRTKGLRHGGGKKKSPRSRRRGYKDMLLQDMPAAGQATAFVQLSQGVPAIVRRVHEQMQNMHPRLWSTNQGYPPLEETNRRKEAGTPAKKSFRQGLFGNLQDRRRPYRSICAELFNDADAWMKLKNAGTINFMSTSFIRGLTISNAIVVLDEMQNLTFHELDSIITRVGDNCRFIMCGDYYQSDFQKEGDKAGILKFLSIIEQLRAFETVEFGWEDIVRSDFVRDYIMTKEMLQIK